MTKEMKPVLQSIIDSIDRPAFIKQNKKIVLTNTTFKNMGLKTSKIEDQISKNDFYLEEKDISDDLKLCEVFTNDIKKLKDIKVNINRALNLLWEM